jgi:hypothetical protein
VEVVGVVGVVLVAVEVVVEVVVPVVGVEVVVLEELVVGVVLVVDVLVEVLELVELVLDGVVFVAQSWLASWETVATPCCRSCRSVTLTVLGSRFTWLLSSAAR